MNAKFGLTRTQIFEAYEKSKALGVQRFALHTMVLSNSLNVEDFLQTAKMMFELVVEIKVGSRYRPYLILTFLNGHK